MLKNNRVLLLFIVALCLIPFLNVSAFWLSVLNNIGLASLVALGLVLLTGVGGMTSFGQAALCGFAAYTSAVLTTKFAFNPWLTLPIALLVTGLAAVILGLITVKLSGHYLPLGTIAWGISLYYLFGKLEFLGRHDGISGIPPLTFFGISLQEPRMMYILIWICVVLCAILSLNLLDSRFGRAVRALRGGRMAAESFGVNVPYVKFVVFVYAALLAGLSGWLYAFTQRAINPTPFGINLGIEYLFMAVLGGAGQVWGAILGAGLVTLLKDFLQRVTPLIFGSTVQAEPIIFGILLVVILQLARQGLWPFLVRNRKETERVVEGNDVLAPISRTITEPLLALKDARKAFGGLIAVNDVSFHVNTGEIVALIGPNGAGKSTTFNLVTGVYPLSAGKVVFNAKDITASLPKDIAPLGLSRSFQHVQILPEMSVLENVALGAHTRGNAGVFTALLRLNGEEERKIFNEARKQIERVGLAEHMHKKAGNLALGQQRLVEIARALCLSPSLLILDEPAAGLRHLEKEALAKLILSLKAEGCSILLVEHDMRFVMGLVDRVVVLDFGTKIAEGLPEDIRKNPKVLEAYLGGSA